MAKLVEIIGVTHNPNLPRRLQKAEEHPGIARARQLFGELRQRLAAARPDVLLVIASDHLNQWFMDNMPPFIVGKAPATEGPFPHEESGWGVPHYKARVDVDLAKALIEGGFEVGVDFAFSDEFVIDHAFTMPLAYLRPEGDLPIVPIFTNCMAPPLPPASRFYQVGEALRTIIERLPRKLRVAALSSGHLSLELGGPRMGPGALDPEFDGHMMELIGRGDLDGLLRGASFQGLLRTGNNTFGFLNFLALVGLARGKPATLAEGILSDTATMPFMAWHLDREAAA